MLTQLNYNTIEVNSLSL